MPVIKPTVHPDGTLEFVEPYPRRVKGYVSTSEDRRLWRPDFDPCEDRKLEIVDGYG